MKHISVLLDEAIDYLDIKPDGIYVDCTLGGGGHSYEILKRLESGHLYAFDQDDFAIDKASKKLDTLKKNYTIIRKNFVHIKDALETLGVDHVDGILYDLGVSSFHFDDPERGFSYNYDAELDMRMDTRQSLTAKEIVNTYDYHELVKILYRYADESFGKQITRKIEARRKESPIETTFDLVDVIKDALPQKVLRKKGHPAKKTFQALRIAVNDELQVFEKSLTQAFDLLNKDGRIVVISFHSLEDRIAKSLMKEKVTSDIPKDVPLLPHEIKEDIEFKLVTKKVIRPSKEELEHNNRAHSAKLRAIKKI